MFHSLETNYGLPTNKNELECNFDNNKNNKYIYIYKLKILYSIIKNVIFKTMKKLTTGLWIND